MPADIGQARVVRRCEECGFDWEAKPSDLIGEIDAWPASYRAALTRFLSGEDADALVRTRPAPQVWSALEYTAHMRDVAVFYLDRIERVLAEDRPRMSAADFRSMAESRRYNEDSVDSVLAALSAASTSAAELLRSLDPAQWRRVGLGSDGDERTVMVLAGRLAHDGHHHLLDVGRALRAVRKKT